MALYYDYVKILLASKGSFPTSARAYCTLPRGPLDNFPSAIDAVSLHLFFISFVSQICVRASLRELIGRGLSYRGSMGIQEVKG
jgi:hypothetical protein